MKVDVGGETLSTCIKLPFSFAKVQSPSPKSSSFAFGPTGHCASLPAVVYSNRGSSGPVQAQRQSVAQWLGEAQTVEIEYFSELTNPTCLLDHPEQKERSRRAAPVHA
eukprot:TRINITY_DN11623_c0_g1_i1.p2 TRINITY_DN11623_c0_g1~~TRINITY_DN11623_c0_g1_i1.p2  ORF type:complete len:108 (+),score=15.16 TRINITY_DN11623_c0_g1_i1:133-456(+)